MNYTFDTETYYSKWLGIKSELFNNRGLTSVYSEERNICQLGYPYALKLLVCVKNNGVTISYGDDTYDKIEKLISFINDDFSFINVKKAIYNTYGITPNNNIKFVFKHLRNNNIQTIELTEKHYRLYLDFYKTIHPNYHDIEWVQEYFNDMVKKSYCHGVICDEKLVSVTDAPAMPYMQNKVQEIGINTISQYQGKGYAKEACISCIQSMIKNGICPQWSTTEENIASQNLAYSVGFEKFADWLSLTL